MRALRGFPLATLLLLAMAGPLQAERPARSLTLPFRVTDPRPHEARLKGALSVSGGMRPETFADWMGHPSFQSVYNERMASLIARSLTDQGLARVSRHQVRLLGADLTAGGRAGRGRARLRVKFGFSAQDLASELKLRPLSPHPGWQPGYVAGEMSILVQNRPESGRLTMERLLTPKAAGPARLVNLGP